ncbi:MAG: ABC transporter substrate-binding protein [Candidatus Omnitrophica bacterium]|nr:ABC transporter substrate-binding protein [Candidatus Omnitrophota bacterium]
MKKMICGLLTAVLFIVFGSSLAIAAAGQKKVGILLWSDEVRYQESTLAMLEQLKTDGLTSLEIVQVSAKANKATAMRLAQGLAEQKMDVYIGVGTNGAAALQKEISEAPVVFNVVYDPVGAGLVAGWQHSKNNVTGVSNLLSMVEIVQRVKMIVPLKNLAVLYTPGQKNSESQLKDLQGVEKDCGINILPVPLTSAEDAVSVIALLKGKAEAVFLTGSGFVGTAIKDILDEAIKKKIVPVSHLPDYVDQGVLLGAGADMKELGQTTAVKVEAALNGTAPNDIPVEGPKKTWFYLNLKTARSIGVTVPDALKKEAVKIVE